MAYIDADWGSNPNDWKFISGNVYFLGGAAIGWLSKKQSATATSSCESKFVAAATLKEGSKACRCLPTRGFYWS